jgi:hypothetical protein
VKSMDETYVTRLIDLMETFMPTVRTMRPANSWKEVADAVTKAAGAIWPTKRLQNSVRRLVAEGLVDRKVLARAERRPRRRTDELAVLVQGLALIHPGISLRALAGQLEAMRQKTPAGKTTWSPTSVANLLNKPPPAIPRTT